MPHFIIMYRPPRATFTAEATPEEAELVARHFEYLKTNLDAGAVLMAGRRDDAEYGIAVVDCPDEQHARQLLANDPVIKAGVFSARVDASRLALWRS